MDKESLDILCCPSCKGDLKLKTEVEENGKIIEGKLSCEKCKVDYDIIKGIPRLLPK